MGDIDFEEQLRQQELEKQANLNEERTGDTYTDKDGTVYEWDHKQKAYVPKIDADFIAQYQMNYGVTTNEDSVKQAVSSDSQAVDSAENEKQWQEYFEYCKKYFEQQQQQKTDSKDGDSKETKDVTALAENDPSSYYYYYYYQYYQQQQQQQQPQNNVNTDSSEEAKAVHVQEQTENSNQQEQQRSTSQASQTSDKAEDPVINPIKRKSEDAGWFDVEDKHNLNVYVSNLPLDITDEEFSELMKKCGLVMFDPKKRTPKLKLYKDENGQPKGDGLCCYIKSESVSLALQILDGYDVRGKKIKVELAKFEMKGEFDPSKKKRKLSNKEKKKIKEKQEKLFDWRPEPMRGARFKREKTVVLQNMFEPKEFDVEPSLLQELREDVRLECSKFGDVRKVAIYDRNPSGVITVTFREPEEADECITALNGRWFAQKRITAETWDGKTKYEVIESEEERQKRLNKWTDYLMSGESSGSGADKMPSTSEKDVTTPLGTSGADPNTEALTLKNTPTTSDADSSTSAAAAAGTDDDTTSSKPFPPEG